MPAPLARRPPTDVESIEELVESARRYVEEGKAKSTRRAYRASFAGFDGWCTSRGLCSCPAPPTTVAVYLAALADAGAAVSTIERALAGIAHEHRSRGFMSGHAASPRCARRWPASAARSARRPDEEGARRATTSSRRSSRRSTRTSSGSETVRCSRSAGVEGACRRSELVAVTALASWGSFGAFRAGSLAVVAGSREARRPRTWTGPRPARESKRQGRRRSIDVVSPLRTKG